MKKLLFIFFILSVITGCDALKKNYGVPAYQIGMSEQDFTASRKNNLTMMEATNGRTIYRRVIGNNGEHMYYYFENGKLVKMRREDNSNPVVVIDPGR